MIAALELSLRAAPVALVQPVFDALAAMMARRHPGVFERMAPWAGASFLFAPVGLPRGLLLQLLLPPKPPRLRVVELGRERAVVAVLSGTLPMLLDLLEGRIDGDAAFFDRQFRFEGDTSAVLALRNATDGEEIDLLDDLVASLPAPVRHLATVAEAAVGPRH